MKIILMLVVLVGTAFAQKNAYEAKWGSQGNGGGSWTIVLNQQPRTCVAGTSVCAYGAHGKLYLADFGTGPFLIDDEGYVFQLPGANYTALAWTSAKTPRDDLGIRDFANGVH